MIRTGAEYLDNVRDDRRLTFQLFAQSPPFAHLGAVYRNFDWSGPLEFVQKSAGLSDNVLERKD